MENYDYCIRSASDIAHFDEKLLQEEKDELSELKKKFDARHQLHPNKKNIFGENMTGYDSRR